MIKIIDKLGIGAALVKYSGAKCLCQIHGNNNRYYNRTGNKSVLNIEDAEVYTVGDLFTSGWGSHCYAVIIQEGPTEEELAKMNLGQRLAHAISIAPAPPEPEEYYTAAMIPTCIQNHFGYQHPSPKIGRADIGLMLTISEFRGEQLTLDESQTIALLIERLWTKYNGSNKVATPTKKLVDALTTIRVLNPNF